MLDELLGRASLKERIDELEEENERLRSRYEAESERRAEAATARQEAEEERNRLEDRIAQLEGELDRLEGEETGLSVRRRDRLRGRRLEAVIDRLTSIRTNPEGALTAILGADDGAATLTEEYDVDLETPLGDRAVLVDDAAPCVLCLDDAGLVAAALEPPAMPALGAGADSDVGAAPRVEWNDRFSLEREWFLPTGRYALALVRTDLFAVGTYEDGDRVDYRGFESDVKGRHSKGGFSQARFERIRDDQIDAHLERCREALADRVGDGEGDGDVDRLFLVGQRGVVETLADRVGDGEGDGDVDRLFLVGQRGVVETLAEESALEPVATAAVDATGDPEPALEDAHRSFWTTELRVL